MRAVWLSNHPCVKSGYGSQSAMVLRRLRDVADVAVAANYGVQGWVGDWEGVPVFPQGFDAYSNDVAVAHCAEWGTRLLFTLFDVWTFGGDSWGLLDRIVSWVPIDHDPVPPVVGAWCGRGNVLPVAMSRFGAAQLEGLGVECRYVPHGVEDVYSFREGIPWQGDVLGRELLGCSDDVFLVGMVANNAGAPPRKAFPEVFDAWRIFSKRHDDVHLYVHSSWKGWGSGIDLKDLAEACGITVSFPDLYKYRVGFPDETMAGVYSALDCLIQPSWGEGFGIPVIEAQAVGTPVIVSDFTAQAELVGDGWLVGGQRFWMPAMRSWQQVPNVGEIVDALEEAYQRRGKSQKAVDFVKDYRMNAVWERYWLPLLRELDPTI